MVEQLDGLAISKSEFIRQAVREKLERTPEGNIEPPEEKILAESYAKLVELSNDDGWIPRDLAVPELAKHIGRPQKHVRRTVIRPLAKRGYVVWQADLQGYEALKVVQ